MTALEWPDRSIAHIAAMDSGASHSLRRLRIGYVADDPDIITKMDAYTEILRRLDSSWQIRRFSDLGSARAWLEPDVGRR